MAKKKQPSPAKAKEMLHNPPHGKPLSDKQRKYFGYLSSLNLGGKMENENNNHTHLPEGFVGSGYYSPQWKSPAWGGQFQMGGSLPGAVGFTYARTGSTPSNGKYAKKTKASAQNGGFLTSGMSGAKPTGQFSANNLQGWNVPVDEAKYLFNALPQRKDDTMVHVWSQDSPSTLLQRKLHPGKPVDTNTIYGDTTSLNRPQGTNINNFQNGGMLYYQHGLDFKTKGMQDGGNLFDTKALKKRNAKRDSVRNSLHQQYPNPGDYNKINDKMLEYFQQEKPINDNQGQYNHPGKVTKINSPNITMTGVPYPVLGVSDLGHTQLMQPEGQYAFNGSNVTEYPLNGGNQNKGQLKKLTQLTDFSNNNNMEQGKSGIHIKPSHKGRFTAYKKRTGKTTEEALHSKDPHVRQMANFARNAKKWHHGQDGLNLSQYNTNAPNFGPPQGAPYQPLNLGQSSSNSQYGNYASPQLNLNGQQNQSFLGGVGDKLGGLQGGLNIASGLIGGAKMLNQQKQDKQQAHQFAAVSNVVEKATETRPEKVKRKYVRPEDTAIQPDQMFPSQGVGTNYLSGKNGVSIVGEIQNTYAPNTLYTDLGYEPLNDSGKVKQFQFGGDLLGSQVGNIGGSLGSFIGGGQGNASGESTIGGTLGGVAGTLIGGPVGGLIGKGLGSLVGGVFGGQSAKQTKKWNQEGQTNLQKAAMNEGVQNLQTQNSSFMENGGWLSHNWNPQVITKFGDYTPKEVYNIAHEGMNSLRTGGNIRQNNMAFGGELKVHGGGHAESISANPYLPDGGETVMFRGKSHADGGMPISFGNSPVEVEGGEPAVKLQDGGTGEDNLVVFGNMKIPSYGVNEIGDEKAKGMKFKNYIAKLSEKEGKQNKVVNKGLKLINDTDERDAFDKLKIASGKALLEGGNMKLKQIAEQKQAAANVQNAILETAKEHGLESEALSQGKIKKAKTGAKMTYAQNGSKSAAANIFDNISQWFSPDDIDSLTSKGYQPLPNKKNILFKDTPGTENVPKGSEDFNKAFGSARKQGLKQFTWKGKKYGTELASPSNQRDYVGIKDNYNLNIPNPGDTPAYTPQVKGGPSITAIPSSKDTKNNSKGNDYLGAIGQLWPYFRPTNQIGLDPNQLSGEMFALSSNQLDPVNAQKYSPLLDQPYDISLQDQLNANQSDFNAIQKQTNYNPAAQSILAGQKYAANSGVLGEQFRLNQANKAGVYSKNRDILNDAQLKNLALLDQQYVRQSQAKSNTKAIAQSALSSIASKIAQNKLENRTLGIYENLYGYRYDNQGRAYNLNSPAQFNIPQNSNELSVDQLQSLIDSKKKNKAKNGYLVKALK